MAVYVPTITMKIVTLFTVFEPSRPWVVHSFDFFCWQNLVPDGVHNYHRQSRSHLQSLTNSVGIVRQITENQVQRHKNFAQDMIILGKELRYTLFELKIKHFIN